MTSGAREEARSKGLRHYVDGSTCKHGHTGRRWVSTGGCVECALRKLSAEELERKRTQQRARYAANPRQFLDKNKKYLENDPDGSKRRAQAERYARWKARHPGREKENAKRWREANKEKLAAHKAKWLEVNHERKKAMDRSYYQRDKQKYIDRAKVWLAQHPDYKPTWTRNRRAKIRDGGVHTVSDIEEIYRLQRGLCAYCRCQLGDDFEVDHIKPVSKGGVNTRRNLQFTCRPCNAKKAAKDPIEFAQGLGRLL